MAVLGLVLGKLGTARHTASELDTLVNGKLGNLTFFAEIYESETDPAALAPKFVVSSSALTENVRELAELPREIMLETDFSDTGKIKDVLQQRRIGMEQGFAAAGHAAAMARVASYYLPAGIVREQVGGVDFYRFLKDLLAHYDERADDLAGRLAELAGRLFVDDGCTVSFTGADDDFERFWRAGAVTGRTGSSERPLAVPAPAVRNEAFIVPCDVSYSAKGAPTLDVVEHSGLWSVIANALSFDYLWNEVRVKGGAYRGGFPGGAQRHRALLFVSRPASGRDAGAVQRHARMACRVRPAPEEMDGYVVSTVAGFDAPLKERMQIRRQDGDFLSGRTPEARAQSASGDDRGHAREASRACRRHRRGAWQGSRLRVRQQGHP